MAIANQYGPIIIAMLREAGVTGYDTVPLDSWDRKTTVVVYQGVGGVPTYYSEGALADKANQRVQMTVWATTPQGRSTAAQAIMQEVAAHPRMEPLTEQVDDYDSTLKLYGTRFDVAVWYDRN